MILPVVVRPEAELDMAAAQLWYEAERQGLGSEFRAALDRGIGLIQSGPAMFPVVYRGVRRALMGRFPYALFFLSAPDHVIVIACVHAKRNPKFVRSILGSRRGA